MSIAETFRWNPAGANPAWKSLASDQKRVLRPGVGNPPDEAYTASAEAVPFSPEITESHGVFVVLRTGTVSMQ